MPNQNKRRQGVRRKLNSMGIIQLSILCLWQLSLPDQDEKFKDRNVLLIDDSIVRGTTSREIVSMARDAGAKKVYFASCAPPITHAHIYGIDLASPAELIAHENGQDRAVSEIAKHIGADRVIFQDLDDLKAACSEAEVSPTSVQPQIRDFEVGVFCGSYVTPVDEGYFKHLEEVRGASKKLKVLEKARQAVANGVAGPKELDMAANGAEVTKLGEVVPVVHDGPRAKSQATANCSKEWLGRSQEEENIPKDRMDINLHNFGDYQNQ
ncbi:MAG: hypothetical protein Q9223_002365 [Gallowayella weberi]